MRRHSFTYCIVPIVFVGLVTAGAKVDADTSELLEQLGHEKEDIRLAAIRSLGGLGGTLEGKKIASDLVTAFQKESNDRVRRALAFALERFGREARAAVPDLAAALKNEEVGIAAARALGAMGSAAEAAIPDLIAALADEATNLEAAGALGKIGVAAIPTLLATLKSEHSRTRAGAAQALGAMSIAAREAIGGSTSKFADAVPDLVAALKDKSEDVRYRAAAALGSIGTTDKTAIDGLIAALNDAEKEVRYQASRSLSMIGDAVIPALVASFKAKEPNMRQGAASAIGGIQSQPTDTGQGSEALQKAVPELAKLLKDDDKDVRFQAAAALKSIGPDAKVAIPSLIEALKDEDSFVCYQSAQALGEMGGAAVPALTAALKDTSTCSTALLALGVIGKEAKDAVPALIEALKIDNADVRYEAVWTLGKIGAGAKPALPEIEKLLSDDNDSVRSRARLVVAKLKALPEPEPAKK